jgi:hypothetical protein
MGLPVISCNPLCRGRNKSFQYPNEIFALLPTFIRDEHNTNIILKHGRSEDRTPFEWASWSDDDIHGTTTCPIQILKQSSDTPSGGKLATYEDSL